MVNFNKRIEDAGADIVKLTELIVDEIDTFHQAYEAGGGEQVVKRVEATRDSLIILLSSLTGKGEKDIQDFMRL